MSAAGGHDGPSYRWAILAGGSVAQASFSAFYLGLPALAPALRAEYGLDLRQIGFLFASVNLGVVATLLPWGIATDAVGERVVITTGLVGAAGALAAAAFAEPYAAFLVLLAAAGALGSCVNSGTGRAVMTWFDPEERGLALGIRQTSIPVAGAAAALSLPWLVAGQGIGSAVLALAAGCLVGAAAGGIVLRDPPATLRRAPGTASAMLSDRVLWRLSLGSVLVCVAQVALVGFLVLFLHDARGLSAAAAAMALAASQLLGAFLRIGAGVWSDRRGARITPLRHIAMLLAVTLGAATLLMHARLEALLPVLVVAVALSMGWNSLSFAAAAELGGTLRSGAAIGLQQTALGLAAGIVPVVFAELVTVTSWQTAFGAAVVFPLAGWWLLRPLAEARPVVPVSYLG
jgi:sugar phosphate permease